MKLVIMSDLHLSKKPWQVRKALKMGEGADVVLLVGDLTNDGTPEQMALMQKCIAEVLPDTLEELGDFVFGNSTMVSLRIPKGLKSEYARQFKGSRIGTLYLPEDFRAEDTPRGFCEKYEWGREQYGYIRSLLVNDVEIGKVVFY